LKEAELYWFAIQNNWRLLTFLKLLVQLPLFLIGLVHIALPTLFVKRFVEKKMKRPVFWSSTKMTLLLLLLPIWNILLFVIASNIVSLDTGVWILLFFAINLVAIGYYLFLKNTTLLIKSFRYNAQSLRSVVAQRDTVLQHLETLQF
jgi:drug/metabolite transporter (DMT)-like permease